MTTTEPTTPATVPDISHLPLTATPSEVTLGGVLAEVAPGETDEGPWVYFMTPPTHFPDHGAVYRMSEDETVDLGRTLFASLTFAGRARFAAALTTNDQEK